MPDSSNRPGPPDEPRGLPHATVFERLDKRGDTQAPLKTGLNVYKILTLDAHWVGRLRYDAFASRVTLDGRGLVDEDESKLANWIAANYGLALPTPTVAEQARLVASENTFHPVRDWLLALPEWDGVERLEHVLHEWFGAEATPLNGRLGACFVLSMVARAMRPGCKVDTVLILVGAQGKLKSTTLRALCHDASWFGDTELDLHSKDRFEQVQGKWLYEIAEYDKLSKGDVARVKAMFSSCKDNWRRPYGRNTVEVPRQVCFCGSTNEDEILSDPSGHRRSWVVRVGEASPLRPDLLAAQREQLFAEALSRFLVGTEWWLDEETERVREKAAVEFQVSHPWEAKLGPWLSGGRNGFTMQSVLAEAVSLPASEQTKSAQMEAGTILRRWGYFSKRGPRDATRDADYGDDGDKGPQRPQLWWLPGLEKSPRRGA